MLTENQKAQIEALRIARTERIAAEQRQRDAANAAERAENMTYWQPVIDAAKALLPDWLVSGLSFEPDTNSPTLNERWVDFMKTNGDCEQWNAKVAVRAEDDHIMTIAVQRRNGQWGVSHNEYTYRVMDADRYDAHTYDSQEQALLSLAEEDATRAALRTRREADAANEAAEEAAYAEERAAEERARRERSAAMEAESAAAQAARAQLESEIAQLINAAEKCIVNASETLPNPDGKESHATMMMHLAFSLAQSHVAIARILNGWRKHYQERVALPF